MALQTDLYAFMRFETDFIEQFGEKERASADLYEMYMIKCIESDESSYYYENELGEHARFNFYREYKEDNDGHGKVYYLEYGGMEV